MSALLYIQASPRTDRSYSGQVADAFIEAYRQAHPQDRVKTIDVFRARLPAFDGLAVTAKYTIMHGTEHSAGELKVWKAVESVIQTFKAADKYVLAVPMWNFGIPYRLKQYLDVLIQPTYTFSFSPAEGYKGLVSGKPMLIIYARGGDYSSPDAQTVDFQQRYLEMVFGFIGFTNIRSLIVQPTLQGGPEIAAQKRDAVIAEAKALAAGF
ncbi:MAG: NAD(P)H-dependent oxidoreductase [Verrucomicrobia bacterium]|nr:NAD(P)H-dependent oxidoreductase [Verrucomicrobiota bacterium]MBU4292051.1 NAD(P)H-dependent oxidoreductase [Verrucomicrobiota bacterium]MBU4427939.1 NAD(P)H-dependent oxidoreductase [Verrucomicrobiota bacterium]MCG2678885.1 NAD(P)H-dependent oxidoreductase [Kiritimatiellia bacterium]